LPVEIFEVLTTEDSCSPVLIINVFLEIPVNGSYYDGISAIATLHPNGTISNFDHNKSEKKIDCIRTIMYINNKKNNDLYTLNKPFYK
jgi:hypothetical protein